ncbi:hypothetical protein WA026_002867 [Henosepilachna vigintioctopunctata]|uniref:Uncharacterized protein n=1 Tax=Henosepilachna vigintioctopunctata TaxID=420089 RepID=A0AAW1TLM4_9CUCU
MGSHIVDSYGKSTLVCEKSREKLVRKMKEDETNSEHMESGTSSGNKMPVNTNILINSRTETNHSKCKEYTKADLYYPSLSSAERSKPMGLSAEYEDIICSSLIVGKVNFIIEAYNSLLKQNKSGTGANKSTRQSIEDMTKHRETNPDFSVQKLRKLFETERPPQMMIASSSKKNRVDYSKIDGKVEKNYGSFETEDLFSHEKVLQYLLEINKYGSTNIEGNNIESQYKKTLEKIGKKCRCNVHVFSDESDIETKMYNDERLMKTLNEHSEYILIDETAHESNDG